MGIVLPLLTLVAAAACDEPDGEPRPASVNRDTGEVPTAAPRRGSASEALAQRPHGRTNVLLITLDTVRADSLGVYGQPRVVTPHIDAFAHEGVLFEDCVSSSPSTLPAHASIFTGRHPYAHGVRANAGYALPESELTLAEALRSHGYRTRAEISSEVMATRTGVDQGFESFHGVDAEDVELQQIRVSDGDATGRDAVLMARSASDITRHGIRFLESARGSHKPFFLWLHYFDPHRPHTPPARFEARTPDDLYLAEVAYTDHSLGDVLTALIRLDLADDTLVVITSDHGEGLGEHDEETHSFFLYDTTIRVPLLMRGPGLDKAKRVASLVRSVDIAPTILDLLGLPPLAATQGVSLLPLMNGSQAPRLTGYGESIELRKAFGFPVLRFLRQGDWKYIHTSPPELYDLDSDPAELDNAAAREPERAAALRAALSELLRETTVPQASTSDLDAETQARLEALGYLAGRAPRLPDEIASLALGDSHEDNSAAADVLLLNQANGAAAGGFHEKAVELYRELSERHPDSAELLRRLVSSLQRMEDPAGISRIEAAALLARALAIDADNSQILVQLSSLSGRSGNPEDAVRALRLALELEPCAGPPRSTLVALLHDVERPYEGLAAARQGVLQCPQLASALNDLAWILATSRFEDLRDGAQAIDLAQRALAAQPGDPGYRDTLAAAYAETGDFDRAAAIISEIIPDLERTHAPTRAIEEFRKHHDERPARRPLRE